MNAACRDSAKIGAGYEDDLKSGKYKKAGGFHSICIFCAFLLQLDSTTNR
jgi:hypothetical protein